MMLMAETIEMRTDRISGCVVLRLARGEIHEMFSQAI